MGWVIKFFKYFYNFQKIDPENPNIWSSEAVEKTKESASEFKEKLGTGLCCIDIFKWD